MIASRRVTTPAIRAASLAGLLVGLLARPVAAQAIRETFEGPPAGWQVASDVSGTGVVQPSTVRAASGMASARAATATAGSQAALRASFTDAAGAHVWQERPGTYHWHRARVFVPTTTIAQLGAGYLTVARLYASGQPGVGWALRVRQGGALSVVGTRDADGAQIEFNVYATLPSNQWVELELGLHSQHGPGVKRAFAFVLNGRVHGWYHQGRLQSEVYDRAAIGIVDTNAATALEVFVDDWGVEGTTAFPTGTDLRSAAALQDIDYRTVNGAEWQIDWTTWANALRLDAVHGLYSDTDRLQSGRNIDRMPDLTSGWAEIEVGWPKGTPPKTPTSYFGPMVGFRKEINREQNFEVIPVGRGGGAVDLVLEAWDGNGPIPLAQWPMPVASVGGTRIPEPGDVIRARWEQSGSTLLVRASYYDASAQAWFPDVISTQVSTASINGINFGDGFHTASSLTTDSPFYSIRRYRVGTLATYPGSGTSCTFGVSPTAPSVGSGGGSGSVSVTTGAGCAWTASTNAAWLAITSGASGAGPGSAAWTAAANSTTASRTGTLTVAGQTVTVTQAGAPPGGGGVGPPRGLAVTNVAAGAVTFRWNAPASGPLPTGYVLAGGIAPGQTLATIPFGTARIGSVGLPPGVYYVRLLAVSDGAQSAPSNEVRAVVDAPVPPSAPAGLVAAVDGTAVALAWRHTFEGGAPTAALLEVSGSAAASLGLGPGETAAFAGVPPGTYTLAVRAVNAAGASPRSNAVAVSVPGVCSGAPLPPVNVLAYAAGRTLAVTWDAAATGPAPTSYVVLVSGAFAGAIPTLARSLSGAVVPGTYALRVVAANTCGQSPATADQIVTVP